MQVTDILTQPPEANKYTALKDRLLAIYEETANRQVQKLISEMELGDQKPSQLLRRMQTLARDKVPDETLRMLWQSHLPTSVRAILTVTDSGDLNVLSKIADKVMESTGSSQVAAVQTTSMTASQSDVIMGELAKISQRLRGLEMAKHRSRDSHRGTSRERGLPGRSRTPTPSRSSPDWKCYYHFRFGTKATKCVQPCSWKSADQASSKN